MRRFSKGKQKTLISALVLGIALTVLPFSSLLQSQVLAATTTMGITTVGTTTDTGDGNSITCNRVTASTTGTLTSMSVYVAAIDSASKNYSLAIYADSNNNPTTRLASATGVLTANAWNTLTFSAPIAADSSYWLCYNSSTTKSAYNNMKFSAGSSVAIYKSQSYGTWPATFGTVGGRWTDNYSLYATITTDATTPTPTLIPTATPTPTTIPTNTPTPTSTPTPTPTTAPFTFGTTTNGSSTDSGDGNSITCNKYTSPNTGTLSSLSTTVGEIDSASKNYSLAIYSDSAGKPHTKLGSANGVLTANTWNTVSVSTVIAGNTPYWLCYNTSTSNSAYNNMKYTSGTTPAVYKDQTYGTWPTSFGTAGASWTATYSMYATVNAETTVTPTPTSTPTATPTDTPTPTASVTPTPGGAMSLISRNVPAAASSGTAASGNDENYNTTWRSSNATAWLAYNLSAVQAEKRSNVLVVWYNEETEAYDPALASESPIEYPKNYTIETNTSPSATAPTSGWVTKATITNNKYHSRQHVIDMTGAHWVRINVSSVNGGSRSNINMDIYDASHGLDDDWIIYGSSTPAMSMNHQSLGNNTQSFSQSIHAARPDIFPVQENGSISGWNTEDGVQYLPTLLPLFPGKYVGIALGANDADQCMDPNQFYNNYVTMIQMVTSAEKVPVIPTPNWSKLSTVQSCGPALVEKIHLLYTNYPQVVKGPDFWTYFKAHPELISNDNQHPTTEGAGIYRQMWADTALSTIYQQ